MISKRRMEDDEDDLVILFGLPASLQEEEVQLDEFGRELPSSSAPHSTVRKERRLARQRRLLSSSRPSHSHPHNPNETNPDYDATDSSLSPSSSTDFSSALTTLRARLKSQLFSDVKSKAFRDPNLGLAIWFNEWREKYPEEYRNAWGGIGLVQAWEFWGRVELVGWVPFEVRVRVLPFLVYPPVMAY